MNIGFVLPLDDMYPWFAVGIAAITMVVYVLRKQERGHALRLERFVEMKLAPRLLLGHDRKVRKPLFVFTLLGFIFLALTLVQPHWGRKWEEVRRVSHDILVCLDVSESMRAENPLPNRLIRAKQKIVSILNRARGDQFGLVVFSGGAQLMCPLTLDRGYFRAVLNAVDTDSVSLEGTNIARALEECMKTFREQDEESKVNNKDSRAILLISDGEQVSGDAVLRAAEASKYARIFVIGVGDPRGTSISYTDRFGREIVQFSKDGPHISKLDESALSRIAVAGDGAYIRSTASNADVEQIYGLVETLFARDLEGDVRLQAVNRYQWPLSLAIACFVAEGLWLGIIPWFRRENARGDAARTEREIHA